MVSQINPQWFGFRSYVQLCHTPLFSRSNQNGIHSSARIRCSILTIYLLPITMTIISYMRCLMLLIYSSCDRRTHADNTMDTLRNNAKSSNRAHKWFCANDRITHSFDIIQEIRYALQYQLEPLSWNDDDYLLDTNCCIIILTSKPFRKWMNWSVGKRA